MIGLLPKMAGLDVIQRRRSVSLQVLATTQVTSVPLSGRLAVFD